MYKYFTAEYYDEWSNHHRSYMPEECPLDCAEFYNEKAVEAIDRYLEQYGYWKDIRDKIYNIEELTIEIFGKICDGDKVKQWDKKEIIFYNRHIFVYHRILCDCLVEYLQQYSAIPQWFRKIYTTRKYINSKYRKYFMGLINLPQKSIPFILKLARERFLIRHELLTKAEDLSINPLLTTRRKLINEVNPKLCTWDVVGVENEDLHYDLDREIYLVNAMRYDRQQKHLPLDISYWDMRNGSNRPYEEKNAPLDDGLFFGVLKAWIWIMITIGLIRSFCK